VISHKDVKSVEASGPGKKRVESASEKEYELKDDKWGSVELPVVAFSSELKSLDSLPIVWRRGEAAGDAASGDEGDGERDSSGDGPADRSACSARFKFALLDFLRFNNTGVSEHPGWGDNDAFSSELKEMASIEGYLRGVCNVCAERWRDMRYVMDRGMGRACCGVSGMRKRELGSVWEPHT
jgi:hypothetical protein